LSAVFAEREAAVVAFGEREAASAAAITERDAVAAAAEAVGNIRF
jgi:hypothetical protein